MRIEGSNNLDQVIQKQCTLMFICGIGVGIAIAAISMAAFLTIKFIL